MIVHTGSHRAWALRGLFLPPLRLQHQHLPLQQALVKREPPRFLLLRLLPRRDYLSMVAWSTGVLQKTIVPFGQEASRRSFLLQQNQT